MESVLEFQNISKYFPGVKALDQVSFQAHSGEVLAFLGENGAGKSTLLKVLNGDYQPTSGKYLLDGVEKHFQSPHEAIEEGISIIYQERQILLELSVAENIYLGRMPVNRFGFIDTRKANEDAAKIIHDFGLPIAPDTKVKDLSIAYQQMVEIMKAYSRENLKVICFDEPTASLSDSEIESLFKIIEKLKAEGKIIIYVSHRMDEIQRITDKVAIFKDGRYVDTVKTGVVPEADMIHMMVGRSLQNYYTRDYDTLKEDRVVLEVENLTKKGVFDNISFKVREGEILGFAGLVGAGRSEIMTCVFGADRFDSGRILLEGKEIRFKNCLEAINSGIAMVTEDRKKTGLTLINSIVFNTTLSSLRYYAKGLLLSDAKKEEVTQEYIKSLNIKALSPDVPVGSMSGGNQQKVVIAKALATKPKILILDEPTRGVDVGAKAEIYSIINELARQGMAIIMISSELPEIINMCDNVCVIKEGVKTGEIDHLELTQERIMKLATGV